MIPYTVYDMSDVDTYMKNKEYDKAYDLLMNIHDQNLNLYKTESPYVMYMLSICHANFGQTYVALDWIQKARSYDQFNYLFADLENRLLIDLENFVTELIPFGMEKKEEVEKIYNYLHKRGFVRSSVQFNMIRFYIRINELVTAEKMLENFLERSPNDQEAKFILSTLKSFGVKTDRLDNKSKVKAA
jgi:tetratricopeptide (TPR) repeat protein